MLGRAAGANLREFGIRGTSVKIWRQLRHVGADVRTPADVSGVKIKSAGLDLIGRFFKPTIGYADPDQLPAVLLLHGIPGTEQNYDVAYALRQAGINCLMFHYRGCWGSPGEYAITNLPEDITAAITWLCDQPTVDPDRIVVVGHSLGGYHALRMAVEGTMHNSRRKPPQGQEGDSDADCGHEEGRKANDWISSAVSAIIPPPVKAIFSFLQNLLGSKRHSEHSARGSTISAQNFPANDTHHDGANETETGTHNSTARAGSEEMREAEEERQFEEDDKGVPGILSRVMGFAAICPLVGTDEVGVPLSDELSTEFASFLQGTSAQELQEQWKGLTGIKEMLTPLHVDNGTFIVIRDDRKKPQNSKERGKTKAEIKEEQKAQKEALKQARRAAKPLLIVTGDVDPLFSADYYRENLIAALDDTVAFNYDWVRKAQGDHALSRYRREVVHLVVSFVCRTTGHNRWFMGERCAVAGRLAFAAPWGMLAAFALGVCTGRVSNHDQYEELRRELTGAFPPGYFDVPEEEEED